MSIETTVCISAPKTVDAKFHRDFSQLNAFAQLTETLQNEIILLLQNHECGDSILEEVNQKYKICIGRCENVETLEEEFIHNYLAPEYHFLGPGAVSKKAVFFSTIKSVFWDMKAAKKESLEWKPGGTGIWVLELK